jgi:hypothetical protein
LNATVGLLRQYLDAGIMMHLPTNGVAIVLAFCSVLLSVLRILSNVALWQEKKSAIRFALIIIAAQLVSTIASIVYIRMLMGRFLTLKVGIVFFTLEIPYVLMLLKIKKAWETTAVSGKELNRQL